MLPVRPTIVCGQPDPRSKPRPKGRAIAWIQLQETPYASRGDAADELDARDGRWTPRLEEADAERVLGLIGEHVENLPNAVISRARASQPKLRPRLPLRRRNRP